MGKPTSSASPASFTKLGLDSNEDGCVRNDMSLSFFSCNAQVQKTRVCH